MQSYAFTKSTNTVGHTPHINTITGWGLAWVWREINKFSDSKQKNNNTFFIYIIVKITTIYEWTYWIVLSSDAMLRLPALLPPAQLRHPDHMETNNQTLLPGPGPPSLMGSSAHWIIGPFSQGIPAPMLTSAKTIDHIYSLYNTPTISFAVRLSLLGLCLNFMVLKSLWFKLLWQFFPINIENPVWTLWHMKWNQTVILKVKRKTFNFSIRSSIL